MPTKCWIKLIFSQSNYCFDEYIFLVDGKVNERDVRIWGSENSHEIRNVRRNSEKITVSCALSIDHVNGSYYFEDPIVIGDRYLQLLNNCFLPMLFDLEANTIFQHDGGPLHHGRQVWDILDEKMPDLWIVREGPVKWPARFPDLSSLDYFL